MSANALNISISDQPVTNLQGISLNSDPGYISGSDDALAYINQIILEYFKSFAEYLHEKFSSQNGLYERISQISSLYAHLLSEKNKTLGEISVDALKAASNSPDELSKLFNSADYHLGDSLENSKNILMDINSIGLNIPSSLQYPVYAKVYDKEKKLLSEGVYFIDDSLRKLLSDNFSEEPSKDFPSASEVTIDIADFGKYEFTIFDQFSNLKISESDLANALPKCEIFLNDLIDGVSDFLKKSLDSINSLKISQDTINNIFKEDKKLADELNLGKINEISELLKSIRLLFHERRFSELSKYEKSKFDLMADENGLESVDAYKNAIYKILQPESIKKEDSMEKNDLLKKILAGSKFEIYI